jgi:RHS repeat-associated protein
MERDPEGPRYYDHARHHDTALGQFTSPDLLQGKIEDPQSWNRYTYTRNNPLKYVDPNGKWPSRAPMRTHQAAIDRALSFLRASDRTILKQQQVAIDRLQSSEESPLHAMTPAGRPRESAIRQANNFVRSSLERARELEASGQHEEAMKNVGNAIHTLQDSTSPSHRGFQEWNGAWSALDREAQEHVEKEFFDPGPNSELYAITLRTWRYFTGALSMPTDFFSEEERRRAEVRVVVEPPK